MNSEPSFLFESYLSPRGLRPSNEWVISLIWLDFLPTRASLGHKGHLINLPSMNVMALSDTCPGLSTKL